MASRPTASRGGRPDPAAALGGLAGGFGIRVDDASFKLADKAISSLAAKVSVLKEKSFDALRVGGIGKEGTKGLEGLAKGLTGVGDVAQQVAGKIYDSFKQAFDQVGGLSGELSAAARAGNQSTQEFQATAHAVSRAGVSLQELGATYQRIRSLQYATKFSTEANFAIQQLGIGVRDGAGKFKSAEVFLEQAVAKLIDVKDPAERTGKALATVGQAGLDLANYFADKGIDAFRAYRREVKELGAELSTTDVQAVAGYKFEVSRLQLVLQGFRNAVAGPLYAALGSVGGQFADWLRGVQGPLREGLRAAVATLTKLVPALLAIGQGLVKLLPLFGLLVQFLGAVGYVVGHVIATVFNFLDGLRALGTEGKVAGLLMFAAFFPMVALFGLIFAVLEDLIRFSQGKSSVFGQLLDGFKKWQDSLLEPNPNDPPWVQWLKKAYRLIAVDIPAAWEKLKALLTPGFDTVTRAIDGAIDSLEDLLKGQVGGGAVIAALRNPLALSPKVLAEIEASRAGRLGLGERPALTQPISDYDPAVVAREVARVLATPEGRKADKEFKATINIVGARASEAKEIGEIAVKAVASWFEDSVLKQSGDEQ